MTRSAAKVLMLSGDKTALDVGSAAYARLLMQSSAVGQLEVFVRAPREAQTSLGSHGVVCGFEGSKLRAARAMARAALRTSFDLVTAQDPFWLGLLAWRIARRAHVLLQLQVHTDVCSPAYAAASFGNWVRARLARFLLRRADRVRVVSQRIAQSLHDVGVTAPITVLPMFIDGAAIEAAQPLDLRRQYPQYSKLILVAARLEKEKRIDGLLRVMKDILRDVPDAGLLIAGDGSQSNALRSFALALGIEKHVVFLGRRSDVFSLYKSVDLVLAATAPYEGYGAATVEALAAGTPVVSEDVGAAREAGAIIAKSGTLAPAAIGVLHSDIPGRLLVPLPTQEAWIAAWVESLYIPT